MGVVYEAADTALRRRAAIKVLRPELFTAAFAARFVTEARALAAVRHPHIVTIYDAQAKDGLSLLIMEFVEGPTLQQLLLQGPLPPETVRSLGTQLASALMAVHGRGIVHCDVKPSNIFVENDRALLGDFGIASLDDTTTTTTEAGGRRVVGTPAYMSPEQLAGARPGAPCDIYSLGLVLQDSLTGLGPEWRGSRLTRNLPAPPGSGDLVPLISKMLAGDPAERPTAKAVVHQLSGYAGRSRGRQAGTIVLGALAALKRGGSA